MNPAIPNPLLESTSIVPKPYAPAIVVIGFNRPHSILRLLNSISRARFTSDTDVPLIISIDFSDTDRGRETKLVAEEFDWTHGPKRLIFHDSNLGLRKHVLTCGDLSSDYGSIIMLEDDLTVGPEFYNFTTSALAFADKKTKIAGISLYTHQSNFIRRLPFIPVHDGYDNFYLQIASSWGQAWTARQWTSFRNWYDSLSTDIITADANIPPKAIKKVHKTVVGWPDCSWLKFFITYVVLHDKYFLYPRASHTTNHSCSGTNVLAASHVWQVPLSVRDYTYKFSALSESLAVYDSYFEIDSKKLQQLIPELSEYDIEVDLYGSKDLSECSKEFVVTSRRCDSPLKSFSIGLKPIELNLQCQCDADAGMLSLAKSDSIFHKSKLNYNDRSVVEYFFGALSFKQLAKNLIRYFFAK